MSEIESYQISEKSIDILIEQIRMTYSHMLKTYLQLYVKQDQFRAFTTESGLKKSYTINNLYDETGKINWDIISHFISPNMEKYVKEEYKMLNENEIRLCCLLFFNLPSKTIASILQYKKKSVYSISFIIKQKMGIKDLRILYRKIILKMISNENKNIIQ